MPEELWLPALKPCKCDQLVSLPPVQEGCEELLLVPPFVAPDYLNGVGKSYILALFHACHILCIHCESVGVLQWQMLWTIPNGYVT